MLRAFVGKVGEQPVLKEIPNELEVFQKLVASQGQESGYIECKDIGSSITIVVNEEGLLFQEKPSLYLPDGTILVGNYFIVGVDYSTGEFEGLSDFQLEVLNQMLPKIVIQ